MRALVVILLFLNISCQQEKLSADQLKLKKGTIAINDLNDPNEKIYNRVSDFEIIMIGELHGTNEPAQFAYGLCNMISQKEGNVIMAMEISPNQMVGYHDRMERNELAQLSFFNGENTSGMNGQSWLNLITKCNIKKEIKLEFFDHQLFAPRDSSMYLALKDIKNRYPNTKIVTLSGNLHNRLKDFNGNKMLGQYILEDTVNFNKDKIMSIMHYYSEGTMLNNMGNGLELRAIESKPNIFNTTLKSEMAFCTNIFPDKTYFTDILYTNKVTHSESINNM